MFAITTHDIVGLHSFDACEKFFNQTEKPRGVAWSDSERPLADKRMHHKRITRCVMSDSYSLVLYQTSMVTYHKDGTVDVYLGHTSNSSRVFLNAATPHGMSMHTTFLKVDTPKGTVYIPSTAGIVMFKPAKGSALWTAKSKLPVRTRKLVHLKKAAALRKKWKPFLEWARVVERLNPPKNHVLYIDHRLPADPPPKSEWLYVLDQALRGISRSGGLQKKLWEYLYMRANVHRTIRIPIDHPPYPKEDLA